MRKEEKETKNSLEMVDDLLSDLEQQSFTVTDIEDNGVLPQEEETSESNHETILSDADADEDMQLNTVKAEEDILAPKTQSLEQETIKIDTSDALQMTMPEVDMDSAVTEKVQEEAENAVLHEGEEEVLIEQDADPQQVTLSETMQFEVEAENEAFDKEVVLPRSRPAKTQKERQREQTRMRRAGKQRSITGSTAYTSISLDLRSTIISAAISLALLVLGIALQQSTAEIVVLVFSYLAIAVPQIVVCIRSFLRTRNVSQGVLVLLATIIVFLLKYRIEAIVVMMLYTAGNVLTDFFMQRVDLSFPQEKTKLPKYACQVDMQGSEERIEVKHVRKDALYFVRDGETIPADGIVMRGEGEVTRDLLEENTSFLHVTKNNEVFAGDVFKGQALLICATQDYDTCAIQKINAMRTNTKNKASIEESVLSNPGKYMALAAVLAVAITFLPPLFKFETISAWLYRALIVFAIGYPSALLLSVPIGFFATNRKIQKNGILIRGNGVIEKAANLRMMIFDKTGVLTDAVFTVKEVHTVDGFRKENCIALAATAEQHSSHPVATSIVAAYGKEIPSVKDFEEIPGQGVIATVQGNTLYVGNRSLMLSKGVKNVPNFQGTVLYVAYERKYIGAVIMEDSVREDAKEVVSKLKDQGILKTILLTGDAELSAKRAAEVCGIESFHASLVPAEKAAKVEFLLRTVPIDGSTAYVGDGVYDKTELKIADVGITMKPQNADMISETSDALILSHDLKKLNYFVSVAKKAHSVNVQNTLLTIAIKIILALLAVFGVVSFWQAFLVDVLVSTVLVLNALKLTR